LGAEVKDISIFIAFLGGLISFVSPCVLPLIPGYLSFISGVSIEEMKDKDERSKVLKKVTINSIFFILGFSLVFILLGASSTFLGNFLLANKFSIFNRIAGAIVILFGLHLLGIFKISFLNYEKRVHIKKKSFGLLGSFLIGFAFAFGWTPCVGPILAPILGIAATQESLSQGILLLAFYSLGLGIPFFIAGIGFNTFLRVFQKIKRYFNIIEIASGIFLIIVGFLIFTNSFSYLTGLLAKWFPWLSVG